MLIRTTVRQLSLTALALAASACLAPGAQAEAAAAPTLKVSYRDLDPNSEAGAQLLYHRIRGAAQFVCGEEGRSLDEQLAWKRCVHTAMSDAVQAVHSPQLSALEAAHSPMGLQTAQLRR
ncbi:MAG TPA: UrcA family protein [Steroidobacteraceae bacterium]|nr:UrcA family protein [Steroidobacteraceae bacterium]